MTVEDYQKREERLARERKQWLASLKVGDKIAVSLRDWTFGFYYRIGKIVKVTPSGRFDVQFYKDEKPERFREDGRLQGGSYEDEALQVTEEMLETNRRHRAFNRIDRMKRDQWLRLPTAALEAILKIVDENTPAKTPDGE